MYVQIAGCYQASNIMIIFLPLTLLATFAKVSADGAYCGDDWITYKEDLCLKLFHKPLTYNEAAKFCSDQGDPMYSPSLIQVKPLQLYSYLAQIGQFTNNNIWIEQKRSRVENACFQIDPRFSESENGCSNDENTCLQIDPRISKLENVPCSQLNLPLCQKSPDWTTEDIIRKLTINHNNVEEFSSSLTSMENAIKKLTTAYDSLVAVNNNFIPIGFIYIEYSKQSSPSALWPATVWVDVTSEFAGQFFRALGGDSAAWDEVQQSCAPRIASIDNIRSDAYSHTITLPTSGFSDRLFTGKWEQTGTATRFNIENCEVRPINSAVKIWKRIE